MCIRDRFTIYAQSLEPSNMSLGVYGIDIIPLKFGVEVEMKRQLSGYIYQYYLPSITIAIASSISFIIPLTAIPGRVALVGTQFLTLTNIFIHQMVLT